MPKAGVSSISSEYRDLSSEEQRAARKKYLDVCDQIMFHLLVIKEPMSGCRGASMAEKVECLRAAIRDDPQGFRSRAIGISER